MLASAFVEGLDDRVLACAVCMKRLRHPKTLPCLHSFCQHCLEDWVGRKEQPICPTCSDNFEVPEGGLQSIPPNTVVNNLLEYVDHLEDGAVKCSYCEFNAVSFCKDCAQNLCRDCVKSHSVVDMLKSHSLLSVEELESLTPEQRALLKLSKCTSHTTQLLKFYCNACNVPICVECIIVEHKRCHNDDNVIAIADASEEFKKTATELVNEGNGYKLEIEEAKSKMHKNAGQLYLERSFCECRIDRSVDEAIRKLESERQLLKSHVETIYVRRSLEIEDATKTMDALIDNFTHMKRVASMSIQSQDPGAALESKERILKELSETVSSCSSIPRFDERNDGVLYFEKTQCSPDMPALHEVGLVTHTNELHKLFEFNKDYDEFVVTKDQLFDVKIAAPVPDKEGAVLAVLTAPSGQVVSVEFKYQELGVYKAECSCPETGKWTLHVSVNGTNIDGSPLEICSEGDGLVRTIDDIPKLKTDDKQGKVTDVMVDEDGYLLVASGGREVLKFDQKTGIYVNKIELPPGSSVYMMCKVQDELMVYSDNRNKCVTLCRNDGTAVRSFGKGVVTFAVGLALDENTRILYVVDRDVHCVFKFNFDNGQLIETVGSNGEEVGCFQRPYHVAIVDDSIIVTDCRNNRLQLLDKKTNIARVLDVNVCLMCPLGIVIDKDGNVIVSGDRMLQLFNMNGEFLKRIDTDADRLAVPCGLAVVSHRPRRVAVASYKANTVKIFNY